MYKYWTLTKFLLIIWFRTNRMILVIFIFSYILSIILLYFETTIFFLNILPMIYGTIILLLKSNSEVRGEIKILFKIFDLYENWITYLKYIFFYTLFIFQMSIIYSLNEIQLSNFFISTSIIIYIYFLNSTRFKINLIFISVFIPVIHLILFIYAHFNFYLLCICFMLFLAYTTIREIKDFNKFNYEKNINN